ncbi:gliding motility lipoprotein GldH [Arenibacter sp. GZD96]|uniref:gliding motility lipoprotein GldH n=1 Tax=Aurantibrevibacter litoralis TaxID=3106030 RepID=UPI002AFEB2FC|nr:gliding motility lipoprotein GldH [Arenibacter sp. GZD-96]MEA1786676.1 gliding motility lipoprotein GldH [Arenibacter sp. GZD-96]
MQKDRLKMGRVFCMLFIGLGMLSCNKDLVFSEYKNTENGVWDRNNAIQFQFSDLDTTAAYNLFINIRNDDSFPYRNLFLIAELDFPNGQTMRDTLEYEMALPNGQWLGKGRGNLKESKLWFKENIVFPSSGVYTLEISQAMRHLGQINGVVQLKGITDVGFQIEKSK